MVIHGLWIYRSSHVVGHLVSATFGRGVVATPRKRATGRPLVESRGLDGLHPRPHCVPRPSLQCVITHEFGFACSLRFPRKASGGLLVGRTGRTLDGFVSVPFFERPSENGKDTPLVPPCLLLYSALIASLFSKQSVMDAIGHVIKRELVSGELTVHLTRYACPRRFFHVV